MGFAGVFCSFVGFVLNNIEWGRFELPLSGPKPNIIGR